MSKSLNGRDGLKVGDIVLVDGTKQVVWFKNDSRAAITPHFSRIKWRKNDEGKIQFKADGDSENISPNSEIEIVERLGREGLANYLDRRKAPRDEPEETESTAEKTDKTMGKKKDKTEKPDKAKKQKKEKTEGIRAGKLGGYEGHSITSVIRSCGKFGWNAAEVAAFCEKIGIPVRPGTISIQLGRGRKGGEGSDFKLSGLSKNELEKVRPKGLEKAEKKDTKAKKDKPGKKAKSKGGKSEKAESKPKKPRLGDKAKAQIEKLSQQVEEAEESPEEAVSADDQGEEAEEE